MSTQQIIRAWRDEEFLDSLDAKQLETLPESPIGAIELTESELIEAEGASTPTIALSLASLIVGLTISLEICNK